MIQPMEITLIEKSGKRHNMTLPDIEPVTSDWLRELCARFFTQSVDINLLGNPGLLGKFDP